MPLLFLIRKKDARLTCSLASALKNALKSSQKAVKKLSAYIRHVRAPYFLRIIKPHIFMKIQIAFFIKACLELISHREPAVIID